MKKHCTAIILAAGSGSRMKSSTAKQFMPLKDKPIIWYALHTVQNSSIIDDCILVTGQKDISYVKEEILERFGFTKVKAIVAGGNERWESVANAMREIEEGRIGVPKQGGILFVHDGARPFLTEQILRDTYENAVQYGACVAAVRSKDTVKISNEEGFAENTPDRRTVWSVQTPQVFRTELILGAYSKLRDHAAIVGKENIKVTDDASVVELFESCPVKLTESDYRNIKITTPEDIKIAETFIENKA